MVEVFFDKTLKIVAPLEVVALDVLREIHDRFLPARRSIRHTGGVQSGGKSDYFARLLVVRLLGEL